MEETSSSEFKKFFLLTFTQELIKHSEKREIIRLQNIINFEEHRKKEKSLLPLPPIPEPPLKKETQKLGVKKEIAPKKIPPRPRTQPLVRPIEKPMIVIPEPKLPEHLRYLRPVAAKEIEIDLGKLNPLIRDRAVRIIEANPGEKVKVTGTMGTQPTGIILSKEEIDDIINKFSEKSKIPTTEGVYRVIVGNLSLSAVISNVVGSKFVIKKIIAPPPQQPQMNNKTYQIIPQSIRNTFMKNQQVQRLPPPSRVR